MALLEAFADEKSSLGGPFRIPFFDADWSKTYQKGNPRPSGRGFRQSVGIVFGLSANAVSDRIDAHHGSITAIGAWLHDVAETPCDFSLPIMGDLKS